MRSVGLSALYVRGGRRLELAPLIALRDPRLDFTALARQEVRDRLAQASMRQEVHAARDRRIEAAQPFIFTARAGLKPCNPVVDTMLDRGIIADIEVQELHLLERAPITPVENARPLQIDCSRHQFVAAKGADEAQVAFEIAPRQVEKLLR